MAWDEAVADAIEQFEANNIDLSNIDTKMRPEDRDTTEHPLIAASKELHGVTSKTPAAAGEADQDHADIVVACITKVSQLLADNSELKVIAGACGAMQGAWQAWQICPDDVARDASVRLLIQLIENCGMCKPAQH